MKQCDTDATTGYEKGWIVFTDLNNDATVNPEAGDKILRVFQGLSPSITVAAPNTLKNYISYTPAGVSKPVGQGAAFQAGSLIICQDGKSRKITISAGGRVRTEVLNNCPAP
jgi:type IV fimbrial biogenesis protein FimT